MATRLDHFPHVWIPVPPEVEAYVDSARFTYHTSTPDCQITITMNPAFDIRWCGEMRATEQELKEAQVGGVWKGSRPKYWDETEECWRFDEPGKYVPLGAVVVRTLAQKIQARGVSWTPI